MANGPDPTRPCRAYQSGLLGQSSSGQGEACHSSIKKGHYGPIQPDKQSPTRPVHYDKPMEWAGPGLQGVDRVGPFATSTKYSNYLFFKGFRLHPCSNIRHEQLNLLYISINGLIHIRGNAEMTVKNSGTLLYVIRYLS